ncbi:MAG: pimeloyl-ACP methyl ester carboxylesterase [Rhodothermales bacterium]|jgi:pimeloyl-ACP methyl ester carboxylesterase
MPEPLRRFLVAAFAVLTAVSGRAAASAAFRLFTTPLGGRRVLIEGRRLETAKAILESARREDPGGVATWVWETGDEVSTVILVHGWTSRALYMTGFVAPLRAAGYRVVAFDFPGHGESSGNQLTFDRAGLIAVKLANQYGNAVLVGHSFGASISVLAAAGAPTLDASPEVRALVLVAGADELSDVTQRFADTLKLKPAVKALIDHRLEKLGGDTIGRFSGVVGVGLADLPTLLIHDRTDSIVPFSDAERIASQTHAELVEVTRLGHNRILYASEVHEHVISFLETHLQVNEDPAEITA